jgi:hypothetical protein
MRFQSRGVAYAYGGCEYCGGGAYGLGQPPRWSRERIVLCERVGDAPGGTILLPGTRGVHVSEGTPAAPPMQQGYEVSAKATCLVNSVSSC